MAPAAVADEPADPDDLALALELADLADGLTQPAFRQADLVVQTKPDRTWVTDADRAVESAVRDLLAARRPGDSVVGEEYGEAGKGPRRWIIDPIDGTSNFVRRVPVWATLLALEVNGSLTVGVASAPALGRRWWAGRGLGAWAATAGGPAAAIHVSEITDLADAHLSSGGIEGWEDHGGPGRLLDLAARCWRDRAFGDFWSHVLVAEGACDIGVDAVVSLWDLAALQVIVEEAGGRFTDLAGVARAGGGSALSTNGHLHEKALAVLVPAVPQSQP